MTVAVVDKKGGVYHYAEPLAEALVKMGIVEYLNKSEQTYQTRDMRAVTDTSKEVKRGPGRPPKVQK